MSSVQEEDFSGFTKGLVGIEEISNANDVLTATKDIKIYKNFIIGLKKIVNESSSSFNRACNEIETLKTDLTKTKEYSADLERSLAQLKEDYINMERSLTQAKRSIKESDESKIGDMHRANVAAHFNKGDAKELDYEVSGCLEYWKYNNSLISKLSLPFRIAFVLLEEKNNISQAFGYLSTFYRMNADVVKAKQYKYLAYLQKSKINLFREEVSSLPTIDLISEVIRVARKPSEGIPVFRLQNVLKTFGNVAKYVISTKHKYLYPSVSYCKTKFISQVLSRLKNRYRKNDVLEFTAPEWPEISLVDLLDQWSKYPYIAIAMPDRVLGEISCDKEFFFTLVNTAYPHSMELLFRLAKEVRHKEVAALVENKQDVDPEIQADINEGIENDKVMQDLHKRNKTIIYNDTKQTKNNHSISVLQSYSVFVEIEGEKFELKYESPLLDKHVYLDSHEGMSDLPSARVEAKKEA